MKLYVHAPIPSLRLWLMSTEAEPPPGHLRLWAAALSLRRRPAKPSTDLALSTGGATDRAAAMAQLDELLALFVRMSQEQRARLIVHAAAMLHEEPPP